MQAFCEWAVALLNDVTFLYCQALWHASFRQLPLSKREEGVQGWLPCSCALPAAARTQGSVGQERAVTGGGYPALVPPAATFCLYCGSLHNNPCRDTKAISTRWFPLW